MKTILITGINRGLGKELFEQFLYKGYFVYGVVRNKNVFKKMSLNKHPDSELILTDISTDESITSIHNIVKDNPIDLIINNAGIQGLSSKLKDIEPSELIDLFNLHCVGSMRVIKALINNLLNSSNPIVINLNSRFGSITRQSNGTYDDITVSYSYRIAKAAQNMLTNSLRKEYNGQVLFVSIHPGKLKTKIASADADIEPSLSAKRIIDYWEGNMLKEENGIIEIPDNIIEW